MSIANEITRLQGAKADLKTAIEGKGVTVPSATKLDGYADLVDDIQTGGGTPTLQDKSVSYTPTESQQTATITADVGYDGLDEVDVTVGAIDPDYVGSNVPRRGVNDLTAGGALVYAPSGYYPDGVAKSVSIITGAKPTAEKGTVSSHGVWVTPYITYAEGYIQAGTKSGTAVRVEASELVSGTKQISANGSDIDVTDYESVDVSVPNSYSASDEGKVVDNGALVSQSSATYTANDTYDTTLINEVTVNVSGGGGIDADDVAGGTISGNLTIIESGGFMSYAFYGNSQITSVSAPNKTVASGSPSVFQGCSGMTSISLPNLVTLYCTSFFQGCSSLQSITLPKLGTATVSYFANSTFFGCSSLEIADLGQVSGLGNNAFNGCTVLDTIILRRTSVASLGNTNSFTNTPFASGRTGGTIYIPKSLYDHLGDGTSNDYKSATNWSTVNGYGTITWAKIEGSIYETQYADGTPIS